MRADKQTDEAARSAWMGVLARAGRDDLETFWDGLAEKPRHSWLRPPEAGLIMVRGRAGGTGSRFNLGEMTVTRCVLRLQDGTAGHATVQGRDKRRAELAALFDALLQQPARHDEVALSVLAPLKARQARTREQAARKAAATKVEFFTLVRGDNPV